MLDCPIMHLCPSPEGSILLPYPPTVLVVDDDADVREVAAGMLEELGYVVVQAGSGAEALTILESRPDLDIMVTDIRMPEMTGLELLERATGLRRDLKVILISGYFQPQVLTRRFLQKPFRTRELDAAIRAELGFAGTS